MTDWTPNPEHTTAFITRWQPGGGSERANYQLFLLELCQLLDLPTPDPASDDTRDNAYVFERRVIIKKPDPSEEQKQSIRELAERLDTHRKRQQEQHPDLTLTNMYNVLEKLRSGEPLTAKEKTTHEQGLVSVLRELHDDLDRAVFAAYGWHDLADQLVGLPGATTPLPDKPEAQAAAEEELLKRLVELNAQRAAEEAQGHIRWLRPDYQNPAATNDSGNGITHDPDISEQTEADLHHDDADNPSTATSAAAGKTTWPKTMREQIAAVRTALTTAPQPPEQLATRFKRNPVAAVQSVLDALQELGIVTGQDGLYTLEGGQ